VLISPLLKEGVSINELEAGVIADFVADSEVMNQYIGRFIRKKEEENKAEIVIFVDRQQRRFKTASIALLKKLSRIKGYLFYYPCSSPGSHENATVYDTTAEIERALDRKVFQRKIIV
jgi:superfamily II DNA or RNA helicase